MDYRQWRARLLQEGRVVEFGEIIGTPLVLATEEQINIYLSWKGLNHETMDPVA